MLTMGLLTVLFLVLAAEFVNGWTDAPNAIVTVVSTRVMTLRVAVLMAMVLNALGAMAGTAVAATIGKGIVDSHAITLPAISAAMVTIITWGTFAGKVGMPVSKSHALLAGIAGAAVAGGGFEALMWSGWTKVFTGMFLALVIGFLGAHVLARGIIVCAGNVSPTKAKRTFDYLQICSACSMAFNHGLNDGQKFIGIFALVLMLGGVTHEFHISFSTILICSGVMGLGTALGGWRIIKTVGQKMTNLASWQGFAAESVASCTIFGASWFGIPLSTTHTIMSSIVGAASSRRAHDVRWGVMGKIALAWILTFPICGVLAYSAALLANQLTAHSL